MPEPWTVAEFQKRRRQTWRAIRLWLTLGAAGLIGSLILIWSSPATKCIHGFTTSRCTLSFEDMALWQINLALASLIGIGVATVAITLVVNRNYRCPRCETVVMRSWTFLAVSKLDRRLSVAPMMDWTDEPETSS